MYGEDEKYDIGVLDEESYSLDTKYKEKHSVEKYSTVFEISQDNSYLYEIKDNGEKFMSLEADDFFIPQQEICFSDIKSGDINSLFEAIQIINYEISDFFHNNEDYNIDIDNLNYDIDDGEEE